MQSRGGTYLPDCCRVSQRRLHRKINFFVMKANRYSQFSNCILMKFDCLWAPLTTSSFLKLSVWLLGPWTRFFPGFHLTVFFHSPLLIFLCLLLKFCSCHASFVSSSLHTFHCFCGWEFANTYSWSQLPCIWLCLWNLCPGKLNSWTQIMCSSDSWASWLGSFAGALNEGHHHLFTCSSIPSSFIQQIFIDGHCRVVITLGSGMPHTRLLLSWGK